MNEHVSKNNLNRRRFLQTSGTILGAAGLAGLSQVSHVSAAEARALGGRLMIGNSDVVLFQGDSITDAGRSREKAGTPNEQPGLGSGYAWLAGAGLLVDHPKA